jgi:beta-RFAP synthase
MLAFDGPMPSAAAELTDVQQHSPAMLTLHAPGRLHLGFLDPAGSLGRPFGSLGLVIEGFETVVELSPAAIDSISGTGTAALAELPRARVHLQRLREHTDIDQPLHLHLRQVLPAHAGFGSGTQLALAIGRAFAEWHGLSVPSATLARWLGRGQRSGIGISGFDEGGLLLDGGPGADGTPAPLLARLSLPAAWRIIVVQHGGQQGLSGAHEVQALRTLEPLPQRSAADICHQVLMRVLPGAATDDFAAFAAGINQVQRLLGEHFAPAQGGSAYTSTAVGQLVQWIEESTRQQHSGAPGAAIGQSSWGPTGFAILPTAAAAQAALGAAQSAGLVQPGMSLKIVRALGRGALLVRP